jgi:DNA/RNA endonuclease G (NUC1)
VAELEKLTGYNFLSEVPQEIQAVIEAKKDSP